jgi:lysophospholipase L1-like esterase/predicted esterase
MRVFVAIIVLCCFVVRVAAQNKDTANISITNFKLFDGTYSWRGDNEFYDMTSWNSSAYLQGHLKQGTQFRLNYRLLPPLSYNETFEPGYPLIVMFHGAGERGNCWNDNCYCPDPLLCNPNNTPVPATDPRFLNNDHNLVHGGSPHLSARNLAAGKLPDDPTLAQRAFPGFVLFPQMTNQWRNSGSPANSDISHAIRIIRLLCKKYNIDEDRIYIHGLSMGGQAVLEALNYADWLFAAAAPMSAISFQQSLEYDSVRNIPFWIFQGGMDSNPKPGQTETMIRSLREKGAQVRYTLYPNLGHGTWNSAYAEPDFFQWFLQHRKSDIHVDFDNPNICGTTGTGASLVLPQGFKAYQWERDGEIIPGATGHTYIATFPGVYRARYSRVSASPAEGQWNRWSDPVTIGERTPESPLVTQRGTIIMKDLNENSIVYLDAPEGFVDYDWYKDGVVVNTVVPLTEPHRFRINGCTSGSPPCPDNGAYTLVVKGYDQCPSLPSKPKHAVWGTHTPAVPRAITNRPNNFTATALSPTSVRLTWTDNSPNERGFEVWRRRVTGTEAVPNDYKVGWEMAVLTAEDVTLFVDNGVQPNSTYHYKIRAVNNEGRSDYFPGNAQENINHNRVVTTPSEDEIPTPPSDLYASTVAINTIRLTWRPSQDESGIRQYYIHYDGDSVATGSSDTTFTLSGLASNAVFNFTVKGEDAGGNISFPSNPSNANTYASGLYYKHSTGAWSNMSQMAATWVAPEFTGWVSTFTLQERTQEDFFNFEFQGFLYITTAGNYSFRTTSDDGSQLFLNNSMIVNNDGLHGNTTVTSSEQILAAGPIPIMVQYFENTGGQSLTVQYRGPDTGNNWVSIPASALRSGTPPALPKPPSAPVNVVATATGMQSINVTWDYELTVVVLGSSTAFGTGASPIGNSWVNLMSGWLDANTSGANVINLALGGFDTYDVIPSGDPDRNITKALTYNPDIIIVNLPSNDVANNIPITTTMSNLQTLKSLADAQGIKIFFTTTQPRNFSTLARRQLLQQTAQEIRNAFGGYVIDIYDELTNLVDLTIKTSYNFDGIHVNNDGHAYIFNTVRAKLEPYLMSFEVQRSVLADGPFVTVTRTTLPSFSDTGLIPDSTYYYRIRTTSIDTVSSYSAIVNASTLEDLSAPSQPGAPTLHRSSISTASFTWTASTDNVGVAGYEVYSGSTLVGVTTTNSYQSTDLQPSTGYNFTAVAFDFNGNKSLPSPTLLVTTPSAITYYSQPDATFLNNVASWKTLGGDPPLAFNHSGQYFVVRHSLPVNSTWNVEGNVSKIIVDDGVTLNVDTYPVNARIEVPGIGVVNLSNSILPELSSLSPASTVNYSTSFVQRNTYGNLGLASPLVYAFSTGETIINGNLQAVGGAGLKGASGNTTTLRLMGDLQFAGVPAGVAGSFGVVLSLEKSGDQSVQFEGDLILSELRKTGTGTVHLTDGASPVTLTLGSTQGGGLSLANGTTLNLYDNNLNVLGSGAINPSNENGQLATSGGVVSLSSGTNADSHLYFAATDNLLSRLVSDVTGGGMTIVHSALQISDGLRVDAGTVSSGGNITLLSTASKTANIEEIGAGGLISGDVNVQRYVSQKTRTYRYISSSVEGVTISDWQSFFSITGPFPGASTGPGLGTQSSLFVYNNSGWVGYPLGTNPAPYNDTSAPVEKGRGYAAYVRNTTPITLLTSGVPYQQDVTYTLTPPDAADPDTGWNLVGNPYASVIEWSDDPEAWQREFVSNMVAVRNNTNTTTGQFEYYDAATGTGAGSGGVLQNGRIAPGQAFWVQTLPGGSPLLRISEKAKVASQQTLFRSPVTVVGRVKLKLTQGGKADLAAIVVTESSSDVFEGKTDALKRRNEGIFNFSTLTSDNVPVAINSISSRFCATDIRLSLSDTPAGTYTLAVDSPEESIGIERIILRDHFLDSLVDLGSTGSYLFTVTADAASSGAQRFDISLERSAIDMSFNATAKTDCSGEASITLANTQKGVAYEIVSPDGKVVSDQRVSNGGDVVLRVDSNALTDGENVFYVRAGNAECNSALHPSAVRLEHYRLSAPTVMAMTSCAGSPATVQLAPIQHVSSYEWYRDDAKIKSAVTETLVTVPLLEEAYYSVVPIAPNGCKGSETHIVVTPLVVEKPVLRFSNDTLFSSVVSDHYEWFVNGISVGRTPEPYLLPDISGSYTVEVFNQSCSALSAPFTVTSLSKPVDGALNVSLYPNPSDGPVSIGISSPHDADVEIVVKDVLGKVIHQQIYDQTEWKSPISVGPVASGIYYVIVHQGNNTVTIKGLRF